MNEDFLQYVWRFQRFNGKELQTTDGMPIHVIRTGIQNRDAGPDFLDARLRIGDTLWAGNVEVHIQASDWYKHGHQRDRAYDNVVLHVVYTADSHVENGQGERIPALCIKDLFDYQTWRYFKSWLKADSFIPCENLVGGVPDIVKSGTVQVAAVERLRDKSVLCFDHLNATRGDIEEAFYRLLLKAFGLKVNALPFEQLSRSTPFGLLRKVLPDAMDAEALLLGQAGFLEDIELPSSYILALKERYTFLRKKHALQPMPKSAWKLFRLRPANFPQLRLAQLAAFYHRHGAVAQKILDLSSLSEFQKLFDIVLHNPFWNTHYTLEGESPPLKKHLGSTAVSLLIVNAVVPFLFALGQYNRDESVQQRAITLLETLPAEENEVMRRFVKLGFKVSSAFDSQGLLQLKKFACDQKKCLTCKAGIYLLDNHEKND